MCAGILGAIRNNCFGVLGEVSVYTCIMSTVLENRKWNTAYRCYVFIIHVFCIHLVISHFIVVAHCAVLLCCHTNIAQAFPLHVKVMRIPLRWRASKTATSATPFAAVTWPRSRTNTSGPDPLGFDWEGLAASRGTAGGHSGRPLI